MSDESKSGQTEEEVVLPDLNPPGPEAKSADKLHKKRSHSTMNRPLLTPSSHDVRGVCDVENNEPKEKRRRDVTQPPVVTTPLAVSTVRSTVCLSLVCAHMYDCIL